MSLPGVRGGLCNPSYWDGGFEDGLWIGKHLKVRNGLQRVCTIPGDQPVAVRTPLFLWGQTEF